MASTDAHPIPIRGSAYRITLPIFDSTGSLVTGAAGLDSEVSKDGAAFVDCTNEATEIATASGIYYLDLTASEMAADTVAVIVKTSTSGAKTTPVVLYPQESDDIRVAVTHWQTTAVATPNTAGYPVVTVKDGTGAGEIDTTNGGVLVAAYASGAAPLQPTVSGRTLDVTSTGGAGIDWSNVESPSTPVALSATTISTGQTVASVAGAVGSVTAGVSVTTNNDKTGYSLSAAAIQSIWDAFTSAFTTVGSIGKRLADNVDAAMSTRLASSSYTAPLDAAATRSAVGLAAANLDTQLTGIASKTTNLPAAPAAVGSPMTLSTAGIDQIFDRSDGVETGYTLRQTMRLIAAAVAGELAGATTTTITIRNITDTKTRITATVDADGNRTGVTYDVS